LPCQFSSSLAARCFGLECSWFQSRDDFAAQSWSHADQSVLFL
jgi:hypothetical protein